MKKINNKGFTLIELLAVITIMGILMMVAIPSVTRTIENARRDTFADIAHEYINAIRNGVLTDQIECNLKDDKWTVASGTPIGWYYFIVDTEDSGTTDLMESGGQSPFGNAPMKGIVVWQKKVTVQGEDRKTNIKYWIKVIDTGQHGWDAFLSESEIKRRNVSTGTTGTADGAKTVPNKDSKVGGVTVDSTPIQCRLS